MTGEQRRGRMAIRGNGACIGNQHSFKQPLTFRLLPVGPVRHSRKRFPYTD
jgi:hypothetical protein